MVISNVTALAVTSAGIPVTKELVGLTKLGGKQPDSLTLIPGQGGKSLTWDVTLDNFYSRASSYFAGSAAEIASLGRVEIIHYFLPFTSSNQSDSRHLEH